MKVLIVDDSPKARQVAQVRLKAENVEIVSADGGAAGLEMARREKPDLILLDVDMPDMSGFDVCRALKSDPQVSMIPIIFLTGSGSAEDKVKGLDLGAVDYVTKPFDAFELGARVRAALRTKHLQDLLATRAQIDPLTELWNRRALTDRLQQEWSRVVRYGGVLSCIIVDLDDFKRVNDTHGHGTGDEVLRRVAGVLADRRRDTDLPTRWGGEEFAVLVPCTRAPGAACLAERYRADIEGLRIEAGRDTVTITASFGVADSAAAPGTEALIEAADTALYRAKDAGKNRVEVFGPGQAAGRPDAKVTAGEGW